MTDTIFSKIIKREIPAEIIYEDERTIVIPDKFPSMDGQTLVITKQQMPYIFELDEATYRALMDTTQKIATALDRAFGALRTCAIIEGFEVPHVHIRLYPCRTPTLTLSPRREAADEELKTIAEKVRSALTSEDVPGAQALQCPGACQR